MSAIEKHNGTAIQRGQLDREQVDLLKRTYCKGADDNELRLFLQVAESKGLDPFSGQIHAVKRWDSRAQREVMSYQVGIDGFRAIADRTGERDGEDDPEWCDEEGGWHDIWLKSKPPSAARVRVYRKGHSRPYVGIAMWNFYAQRKKNGDLTKMWSKGGPHMIAKCAEALALRKAFPEHLDGLYAPEEMAQASNPVRSEAAPVDAEVVEDSGDDQLIDELTSALKDAETVDQAKKIGARAKGASKKVKDAVRPAYKEAVEALRAAEAEQEAEL